VPNLEHVFSASYLDTLLRMAATTMPPREERFQAINVVNQEDIETNARAFLHYAVRKGILSAPENKTGKKQSKERKRKAEDGKKNDNRPVDKVTRLEVK